MMTPLEFHETVLPDVLAAWDERCFCRNGGFQKLLGFNFRNYGIMPAALQDSELLIDAIVRRRFQRTGDPTKHEGELSQDYVCPQCEARCTEHYAEFSLTMHQSYVVFHRNPLLARQGLYLVGFFGYHPKQFRKVGDYQPAATRQQFLQFLKER